MFSFLNNEKKAEKVSDDNQPLKNSLELQIQQTMSKSQGLIAHKNELENKNLELSSALFNIVKHFFEINKSFDIYRSSYEQLINQVGQQNTEQIKESNTYLKKLQDQIGLMENYISSTNGIDKAELLKLNTDIQNIKKQEELYIRTLEGGNKKHMNNILAKYQT